MLSGLKAVRGLRRAAAHKRGFATLKDNDVVILSASRTPIGTFNGGLSSFSATQLGSIAVRDAIAKSGVDSGRVDEVILGNVISANLGQAPARQAAVKADLSYKTICTTVNKVCSSGMKTLHFATMSIQTGASKCIVAGGFESMSNAPFYLPKARGGYGYGHGQVLDSLIKDGLWDAFDDHHMGSCAEVCAREHKFTREDQDNYALESYRRARVATESGLFKNEIVPVEVKTRTGSVTISEDEQFKKLNASRVPTLKPAFEKNGTVTAANASALNDGASALVLASYAFAKTNGLKPLARVLAFADAERPPVEFPIAPALAIPKAIERAGLKAHDVDFYEINEAFSVVSLANMKLLNIKHDVLNVNGGGVALGHPIGSSGSRIVVTLLNVLKQRNGTIGVAGICNGGGGATSVVIERLD